MPRSSDGATGSRGRKASWDHLLRSPCASHGRKGAWCFFLQRKARPLVLRCGGASSLTQIVLESSHRVLGRKKKKTPRGMKPPQPILRAPGGWKFPHPYLASGSIPKGSRAQGTEALSHPGSQRERPTQCPGIMLPSLKSCF